MIAAFIVTSLFADQAQLEATKQSASKPAPRASDAPPPPELLQAGDLLWPKVPGVWVPYSSKPGTEQESEGAEWNRERDAYLAALHAKSETTDDEKARYRAISQLDYSSFKVMYLADSDPNQVTNFGASVVYVGHVGIVDIVDGKRWVYEALMGTGVRKILYSDWLIDRKGELVWLGRVKDASAAQRAKIATTALQYIDKPYRFFNFDLTDPSGFYCSKLAWLSITVATGLAPDDNPNPRRLLWYSPKRLMRSPHITMVYSPGNYAIR
jgi:uncharacterized protein YycO